MSRKTTQPQTSPQCGGGVDFLVRTMIEREATGKRPIRPKNVDDLINAMQDESDDPDFDYDDADSDSEGSAGSDDDDSSSSGSDKDTKQDKNNDDDSDSDDEDYNGKEEANSSDNDDTESDTSDDESADSDSESDGPEITKKSALRETLQKLNEANELLANRPAKKKRRAKSNKNKNKANASTKKSADSKKSVTKSRAKAKATKSNKQSTKSSKRKKTVVAKKSKHAHKKIREKRKKKKSDQKDKDEPKRSIANLIDSVVTNQKENRKEMEITKPICSACLGDKSDDANEIVECDSCGISVHEICYGLSDNVSISSGSGSSSCTEPWFCDVCKSGSENISCELCPVEGGLFKESTAGRWVHLVCAMYTQGVALHNDSSINLYEIHYGRWGSHTCSACENERQAQTGIVISCDAGMCRTYFHATCAQKLGLLSDPTQVDFDEADPYYVSCKMHINRETIKKRLKLFNTLQEQLRIKKERKEMAELPAGITEDIARIHRKLEKVRQKTALKRAHYLNSVENVPSTTSTDQVGLIAASNLPSSWTSKKQRLMHTSAKLGNDFIRKTERLGEDIKALEREAKYEKICCNVKRKWNVLPAMSVEYAAYYSDRENRITNLMEQCDKSVIQNTELIDKEISLKDVWETYVVNKMAMTEETDSVSEQLESLASILTFMSPNDKRMASKLQALVKPKELASTRRKSPSTSRGDRKSPSPRRGSTSNKKTRKSRVLSPSESDPFNQEPLRTCDACLTTVTQHLITRCDQCFKHFHLRCLDPPLTRMPKRSRLCGWMCSDCSETPEEVEERVDTEAPRTLRGRTKIRKPGKYRGSDASEEDIKNVVLDPEAKIDVKKSSGKSNPTDTTVEMKPEIHTLIPFMNLQANASPNEPSCSLNISIPLPTLSTSNGYITSSGFMTHPSNQSSSSSLDVQLSPQINNVIEHIAVKPKLKISKRKKSTAKVSKKKPAESADVIDVLQLNLTTAKPVKASPKKRKSTDKSVPSLKVNGISETHVPSADDFKSVVPKLKKKKKKNTNVLVSASTVLPVVHGQPSTNGTADVEDILTTLNKAPIRPKARPRPRKKKEAAGSTFIADAINAVIKVETNGLPVELPKKIRKRPPKKPVVVKTEVNGESIPDQTPKKKTPKTKSLAQSAKLAGRDEKNGVTGLMGKVTSQIFVDKITVQNQNGTPKPPSKKRKTSSAINSSGVSPVSSQAPIVPILTSPEDKEKEKSVPPKKRKRAPSNAQQSSSTLDSIIQSVSTGGYLVNGSRKPDDTSTSTIMQGMSGQHNIMQGNSMGTGSVSSGETVTADVSFIIDGTGSGPSGYNGSSLGSTFYAATDHHSSTRTIQTDGSILKLSGGGNDPYHFQSENTSNNNDNVIRLQYIDQGADLNSSPGTDTMVMPPPANGISTSSSNSLRSGNGVGVCAACTKTDANSTGLVVCFKCRLEFHYGCLPAAAKICVYKKQSWCCRSCDEEGMENSIHR